MASLSNPSEMYAGGLTLSDNGWVEQITTDIPFISVGILALAVLTCLFITQRLSFPATIVVASAILAFVGAVFDFAQLLQRSNNPSPRNSASFPLLVLRDVSLSLSLAAEFFFFLLYLGRAPLSELALALPEERKRARRRSPSRWGYWGIVGFAVLSLLAASIVAVATLEIIWRVTANERGTIYMVDGIIQGIVVISFLGKIFLNAYFSPVVPKLRTLIEYSPAMGALLIRLGVILADEFSFAFSEAPLGRLLQAILLYILLLLVLVSPFYSRRSSPDDEKASLRRASSFRGLRDSRWSVLNSVVGRPNDEYGRTTTQRLSSWLTDRLQGRKDPQEDRLFRPDTRDLEAYPASDAGAALAEGESPIDAKFTAKPLAPALPMPNVTYLTPFINTTSPDMTTPATNTPFSYIEQDSATPSTVNMLPPPPPRIPIPPPAINFTSSRNSNAVSGVGTDLGTDFIARVENRRSFESESDSPIYGMNGIIQKGRRVKGQKAVSTATSDAEAVERLKREQAELDRSVASMAAFSPSRTIAALNREIDESNLLSTRNTVNTELNVRDPAFLSGAISGSYKSDVSLRDFPSPPASPFSEATSRATAPPAPKPVVTQVPTIRQPVPPGARPKNGTETVDDMQFAMVPPRMPAAYENRRASFPSGFRESLNSSVDGMGMARIISAYAESEDSVGGKRVRISGNNNNRLDVTSFIGELTTPRAELAGLGKSSYFDTRLPPLPEDTYAPITLDNNSFMAISTDPDAQEPARARKVSFAPVSYVPSSRPRLRTNNLPSNAIPESPEKSGGSPKVPSPPGPNLLRKVTGPSSGRAPARPPISAPLLQSDESNDLDYEAPRPAPILKPQRF